MDLHYFQAFLTKTQIFQDRQKFLRQNIFGKKYISLQSLLKFSAEISHLGHCLMANLPAKPIFSKIDLNLRGKIEDRQKFLTKKMSEISSSKNIVSEKYIFYALFSILGECQAVLWP